MSIEQRYRQHTQITQKDLKSIAEQPELRDLSRLSLPEIEMISGLVARVIPAGNVPGVILNALIRLPERKVPPETAQRDIRLLFKGVEQTLDVTLSAALFAGPAAILWGYQNLLKLAGKPPEAAFPEGTWQFYANYALREDTARHANETHGFDEALRQHGIQLSFTDRATAWVMAAIYTLYQYNALLENEWRERVYTATLREMTAGLPDSAVYANLYRAWQRQIPYRRDQNAVNLSYPTYRAFLFDQFLAEATHNLPVALLLAWQERVRQLREQDLTGYQKQMSILAYLQPDSYSETRVPIPFEQVHVGLIYQGQYYLIRASDSSGETPAALPAVRAEIHTILHHQPSISSDSLMSLASLRRVSLARLRQRFSPSLLRELDILNLSPILINLDPRPPSLPLAEMRQAERGTGSHPLTILDTGETFAFDQSHIFFDGGWGAALSEIMTNEALSWGVYLHSLPRQGLTSLRAHNLTFRLLPADQQAIISAPRTAVEASAENRQCNLPAMIHLRRLFKQRNDRIDITINDLLILYHAIHAVNYRPDPELSAQLRALVENGDLPVRHAAQAALESVGAAHASPAVLVPMDASQRSPRERIYALNIEVPLAEFNLLSLHQQTLAALDASQAGGNRSETLPSFNQLQREYLAILAGFGTWMARLKEIAAQGESSSVGTIKMLAHLPPSVQRLLDQVPSAVDLLNDLIKGREVFSNIGVAAPTSSLTRFLSAKDDNEKKNLVWSVITNHDQVMHISLRDFRPHVAPLADCRRLDLANALARDYLDSYVQGLNRFIAELHRITIASRLTVSGGQE